MEADKPTSECFRDARISRAGQRVTPGWPRLCAAEPWALSAVCPGKFTTLQLDPGLRRGGTAIPGGDQSPNPLDSNGV